MVLIGVLICDIFSRKSSLNERARLANLLPRTLPLRTLAPNELLLLGEKTNVVLSELGVCGNKGTSQSVEYKSEIIPNLLVLEQKLKYLLI